MITVEAYRPDELRVFSKRGKKGTRASRLQALKNKVNILGKTKLFDKDKKQSKINDEELEEKEDDDDSIFTDIEENKQEHPENPYYLPENKPTKKKKKNSRKRTEAGL